MTFEPPFLEKGCLIKRRFKQRQWEKSPAWAHTFACFGTANRKVERKKHSQPPLPPANPLVSTQVESKFFGERRKIHRYRRTAQSHAGKGQGNATQGERVYIWRRIMSFLFGGKKKTPNGASSTPSPRLPGGLELCLLLLSHRNWEKVAGRATPMLARHRTAIASQIRPPRDATLLSSSPEGAELAGVRRPFHQADSWKNPTHESTTWNWAGNLLVELMREYKRSIDKATREIEKERTKLQNQEKKIITDIKKAAKDGQMVNFSSPGWLSLLSSSARLSVEWHHRRRRVIGSA
jgi:hypothetical protein